MMVSRCESCNAAEFAQPRRVERAHPVGSWRQAERVGSAQATEARTTVSQAAGITITTAEGDKITLSFAAQSVERNTHYRAAGRGEAGSERIAGTERESARAAQWNVAIEGDLSERETGDIQKLIQAFGKAVQGDASGLAEFGSLESLTSAQMNYSYSRQSEFARVRLYA